MGKRLLTGALAALLVALTAGPAAATSYATDRPAPPPPGTEPYPLPPEPALGLVVGEVRVSGGGQETAVPGTDNILDVVLLNAGAESLTDLSLTLEPGNDGVRVIDARSAIGSLGAGEQTAARFRFTFDVAGCPDQLLFVIQVSSSPAAGPLKFNIPTACPGPRLAVGDVSYEGGDGDGIPEPGERLDAFITLVNVGRDPARTVSARLSSSAGVRVISAISTWPDIGPGESKRSLTPFVIDVSANAPLVEGCPPTPGDVEVRTDGEGSGDTAVSSDGTVVNPVAPATDAPVPGGGGSEPGAGSSEPGAGGSVDPIAPGEPMPMPDPDPMPMPVPEPVPGSGDLPAVLEFHLQISAAGYRADEVVGTQIYCALAGADLGGPEKAAETTRNATRSGSSVILIIGVLLAVAASLSLRQRLARRRARW